MFAPQPCQPAQDFLLYAAAPGADSIDNLPFKAKHALRTGWPADKLREFSSARISVFVDEVVGVQARRLNQGKAVP